MTPAVRCGCDVVDVDRFSDLLDRRPELAAHVFTERELADARRGGVAPHTTVERTRLAARFAAKEAVFKTIGGGLRWHDVEVRTADGGAPQLWLRGQRSELGVSLSHDAGIAIAIVVDAVGGTAGAVPGPAASALAETAVDAALGELARRVDDIDLASPATPRPEAPRPSYPPAVLTRL